MNNVRGDRGKWRGVHSSNEHSDGGNDQREVHSNRYGDGGSNWKGIRRSNMYSDQDGNRKGKGYDNGRSSGKEIERNANINEGHDQKSTSDVGSMTPGVQHAVSMRTAQMSVVALLVTSEATSSVGAAWWSLVESNAEWLFRKFFFLAGSLGERIRRENVLKNRKRMEIYLFVLNNPFSHFRRITRMVGVGPNEGSWHLGILEKMGLVKSEYVGRYLTYHANNSGRIGRRDGQPLCLVRNGNATKILMYLLRRPDAKIAHMTEDLMINRSTISYHIKRMQTSGLIERVGTNGLRLSPILRDQREALANSIESPVASRSLEMHPNVGTISQLVTGGLVVLPG